MVKHTDKIEEYINGEMPPQEAAEFEQQVKADPDLAYEVRLYQLNFAGIEYAEDTDYQPLKNRLKAIGEEIAKEEGNQERETPILDIKPNRSRNARRLLALAASLLLILLAYFLIPKQQPASPMASISQELVDRELSDSRSNDPSTPVTIYQQGVKFFKEKEYEAAINQFDQVIENKGNRAKAQFLKADALHRSNRKDEARKTLQSIQKADSEKLYNEAQSILEKY